MIGVVGWGQGGRSSRVGVLESKVRVMGSRGGGGGVKG